MLEALTLYSHAEHVNDPAYNVDGAIEQIITEKKPEYSTALRGLIMSCVEPKPSDRIRLDSLRALIASYRGRVRGRYRDGRGRAKFESENLLYYVNDEINNMPTGSWIPYDPEPTREVERFPDGWPIKYPRFDKGREGGGGGSEDSGRGSDSDSDDDDDNDGDGNDDSDDDYHDDDDAVSGRAARADGGTGGPEDSLTDGRAHGALYDGGTDDESQAMEPESDGPASPPLSARRPSSSSSAPRAPAPIAQPAPRRLRNGKAFAYF